MRQTYRTYGLTLESDLPITGLTHLPEATSVPHVHADFATLPSWAAQALSLPITAARSRPASLIPGESPFTVSELAGRSFFQLTYGDGTRFLMDRAATRIWGAPGPGLSHDDLCVYLIGPIMGFLLRQRGLTTLHASSLSFHGRAVALVGEAGAGKSTTAAALALRGWPVLCEDVCALQEAAGEFQVLPAYPRVCLWPDSVRALFSSSDTLPLIVEGWDKRFLPLDGSRAHFASSRSPLAAIFLLAGRTAENSAPCIQPVSQREAVLQLLANTYMNWLLDRAQRAEEFDVLARLVSDVECYRIVPSSEPARLQVLAELIEAQTLRLLARDHALGAAPSNV